MLLKFTLKNFLSFKDRTILTMTAASGGKFGRRLMRHPPSKRPILPVAGVFGGPSAGGADLARALSFLKSAVMEEDDVLKTLTRFAFQNLSDNKTMPVRMGVDILADGAVWQYGFSALQDEVVSERLTRAEPSGRALVFERRNRTVKAPPQGDGDGSLKRLSRGLPRGRLLLSAAGAEGLGACRPVCDWFRGSLQISGPGSSAAPRSPGLRTNASGGGLYDFISLIDRNPHSQRLDSKAAPPSDPIHEAMKRGEVTACGNFVARRGADGGEAEVYFCHRSFNEYKILKVHPFDKNSGGDLHPVARPFSDEREKSALVSLLSLEGLSGNSRPIVCVNTRFDESFDLISAHRTLSGFLDGSTRDSRSQFILTLSSPLLLDRKLFRPDEIWITERGDFGNTSLLSLSDYRKSTKSRDAWKGYSSSRIGGIYPALHMAALESGRRK
jgi:hypothetical protein